MNFQTIADVYAANDKIRERLKKIVADLSAEQAAFLPESEKWTVAGIVEHLSLVEEGMTKISAKLLREAQAKGEKADGKIKITGEFLQKIAGAREQKFNAPEMVHPSGTKTIAESLAKMEENRQRLDELRPLFESVGCGDLTFPHPVFGQLNANEWLVLLGGHESRHIAQIERILKQI